VQEAPLLGCGQICLPSCRQNIHGSFPSLSPFSHKFEIGGNKEKQQRHLAIRPQIKEAEERRRKRRGEKINNSSKKCFVQKASEKKIISKN
tara:strand:- start:780 stop:1052 length:273 start_codon:yes stop_codon:yes gene_type:complete